MEKEFEELINSILDSSDYKKYKQLKEEMLDNKKINDLIKDIKTLQKELVNKEYRGLDINDLELTINKKLDELKEIPLYNEYNKYFEIINSEILLVKESINNYIDNLVND